MNLQKLRNCQSIEDLISSFSIKTTPRKFAYVVYKIPDNQKYIEFEIKKANGSPRKITAPKPALKYLQKSFADIILNCVSEIQQQDKKFLATNHGFEKYKSIISNARVHQSKKYLLNIDIKDFFESIHFGRIKGYLSNDKHFKLHNKTAEIIASLATYGEKKRLPQGSPLSPILSVLIGSILDEKLMKIAKTYKLSYTRYADDITFSSNRDFSNYLLKKDNNGKWKLKNKINKLIEDSGFQINKDKTRYTNIHNKQLATGLVVNKFTNSDINYKRQTRAMVHSLITKGNFTPNLKKENKTYNENYIIGRLYHSILAKYKQIVTYPNIINETRKNIKKETKEQILTIIKFNRGNKFIRLEKHQALNILRKEYTPIPSDRVKDLVDSLYRNYKRNTDSQIKLLRTVLIYKYFINIDKPTIIPEGKTDSYYLKTAINSLSLNNKIHFQKINRSLEALGLSGGTTLINDFVTDYYNNENFANFNKIKVKSNNPIIFILDYDKGLEKCGYIIDLFKKTCGNKKFINIKENLYVLLLSPFDSNSFLKKENMICSENLIKYNGENIKLDPNNHERVVFNGKPITKSTFLDNHVRKSPEKFDFSGFIELFDNIREIVDDYKNKIKS